MTNAKTVRIGVLGAARIAPNALIAPARDNAEAEVVAVAARDRDRAAAYAQKHGIGRVHGSYEELLADPDIDAVYNPLPNGLHGRWTRAALAGGKHVLCEKPFTANAAEAREIGDLTTQSDRVVMEAFHYRYHPLAERMKRIVDGGTLGRIHDFARRLIEYAVVVRFETDTNAIFECHDFFSVTLNPEFRRRYRRRRCDRLRGWRSGGPYPWRRG